MHTNETGALIVGAGPTGLTLACELARRGAPFRIVSAADGPSTTVKASELQSHTLEVFEDHGSQLGAWTSDVDVALTDKRRTNAYGVAVSPDGTHVYVTNNNGLEVWVIDTATNTVTGTIDNGAWGEVAFSPDGSRAYAPTSSGPAVIGTASNTVTSTVAVGDDPRGVAVSPDGTHVYVTNQGGETGTVAVVALG